MAVNRRTATAPLLRASLLLLLLRLQLLLLLLPISGCQGYKPLIQPDVPEILLNEGETLEITCTNIADVNLFYPEDDESANISTSEHEIIPEEQSSSSVKIKFRRPSTVFGDTGWYGCADAKAEVNHNDYNDPNSSWVYVYVKSNESAFVQSEDFRTIFGAKGNQVVLPCRPTSPTLHVDLSVNGKILEVGDNISFDPKIGFTLKNLTQKDSGVFSCEINQDGLMAELTFLVKVIQKDSMKKPEILKDNLQHVTAGSSLHVKCTVHIGIENQYSFNWITPRNSSSRKILPPTRRLIEANTYLVTSELVEEKVTFEDEGEYICQVNTFFNSKSTSVYIRIHDPGFKFINLTSHDENRHFVINASKPVTFSAYVVAYPTPTLTWFDVKGNEILSDANHLVENDNSMTTLTIKNVKIGDMGVYTVEANNGEKIERLNFTLEVLAKPWAYIKEDVKYYYSLNESATFTCQVVSNPVSNVSWFYTKCPNLPSMDDCERVEIKDTRVTPMPSSNTIYVEAMTDVTMSGKINCLACNIYGCDSVEKNILVSDGLPDVPSGIIPLERDITVGDDVAIVCTASVYNYSSVVWVDKNETALTDSERIKITYEDTRYTHRSILSINNVQKSDEGYYYCLAINADNDTDKTELEFIVADPEKPHFVTVNMNGSEVTVSANDAHKTVHLLCYVKGMPIPNITWYKDDQLLELSEQFTFESNNQHLIIKYLMEKDSGKYSCVAKNRFGEIQSYQKFIVKGLEISKILVVSIIAIIGFLIILLIYFCIKVRRERNMRKQLLEAGLMHFEEGALDCINPELTVDDQAELLPYDRKWEFPREKLKLGKQLGSGYFGVVMKAEAYGIRADESCTTVAVKMVRKNAEPAVIGALASELKVMAHLGKHLNVVNLLGACTNNIAKRELLVIVEYCRFGNLHDYLFRHRESFINQIDPETGKIDPSIGKELLMRSTSVSSNRRVKYAALSFSRSLSAASSHSGAPGTETVVYCANTDDVSGLPEANGCINSNGSQPDWLSNYRGDYKDRNLKPICSQDLLSWAFQVARGMEYLSHRKVLHGDLAARNILLAENNVVKICDFGLAKTMYKDENYKKKSNALVPIKWLAIESIRDQMFSTQSDVWSFGIVLWEFFTLAETPYPGMKAELQYQKLVEGYRLEQPKYATKDIYDIMTRCWKAKPTLRPSFTELAENLGELLEEGVKMHYVELNSPYLDMNASMEGKNDYLAMMLTPDHAILASPHHDYINSSSKPSDSAYLSNNDSPLDESGIFSPRPTSSQDTRFSFSDKSTANLANSATHSDGEDSPMLKKVKEEPEQDDDNYLKPINIHKKREEFMKQREAEKRKEQERSGRASTDRDSGYCNTPKNLDMLDVRVDVNAENRDQNWRTVDQTDGPTVILSGQDNYVNIPRQNNERHKDVPDSFMNPSYIFVETNKSKSDRRVL